MPDIKKYNRRADFQNCKFCPKREKNYAHKKLHTLQKITIYQSVECEILNKIVKQLLKMLNKYTFSLCLIKKHIALRNIYVFSFNIE